MICDLCKRSFEAEEAGSSCNGCGMAKQCGGLKCPHCFYEMIPELDWINKISRFLNKISNWFYCSTIREKVPGNDVVLSSLQLNTKAFIQRVTAQDKKLLRKIIAIGALPGAGIELLQKFPSYVFQIGESQFSVDTELASSIVVQPHEELKRMEQE